MSEYQYYEFQAVDRRLTEKEMAEMRARSTRARITSHELRERLLVGELQGQRRCVDGEVLRRLSLPRQRGTHVLKLRLPARLLDLKTARLYAAGEHASAREKNGNLILTFHSEDEAGGHWVEGEGSWRRSFLFGPSWPRATCAPSIWDGSVFA